MSWVMLLGVATLAPQPNNSMQPQPFSSSRYMNRSITDRLGSHGERHGARYDVDCNIPMNPKCVFISKLHIK